MKMSSYYYNRLWRTGRPAPFVVAREIIENGTKVGPDAARSGFFKYELGNWEMIYNPATNEIWHLQPFK